MALHDLIKNRAGKAITLLATPGLQLRRRTAVETWAAAVDLVGCLNVDRAVPVGFDARRDVEYLPQTATLKCPPSQAALGPHDHVIEADGTAWDVGVPTTSKGQGVYHLVRVTHPGHSAGGNRGGTDR